MLCVRYKSYKLSLASDFIYLFGMWTSPFATNHSILVLVCAQQLCFTLPHPCISVFLLLLIPTHFISARLYQAQPQPSSSPRQPQCHPICTPKQWKWQAHPLRRSAADSTAVPDSAPAALPAQRGAPTLSSAGAQAAVKAGPASSLGDAASHHHGTSHH